MLTSALCVGILPHGIDYSVSHAYPRDVPVEMPGVVLYATSRSELSMPVSAHLDSVVSGLV